MFTVAAIIFIAASLGIIYYQSLEHANGKTLTTDMSSSIELGTLGFEHTSNVIITDGETPTNVPVGNNHYDNTVYEPNTRVANDAYFEKTLFIGDSRTEGFALYTGIPNIHAYYSKGLNVETIETLPIVDKDGTKVTILEALKTESYDNIYIMFGVNELGWSYDYLFTEKYATLVDKIAELQPNAVIYVQNILPVSAQKSASDNIYNNENVNHFNDMLLTMCDERPNVIYLDVAASVKDSTGALPPEASTDGIHCNKDYCMLWLTYIRVNTFIRK